MSTNQLSYFLIKPNVISSFGLSKLSEYVKGKDGIDLQIFDPEATNETSQTKFVVNKEQRKTKSIYIDDNELKNIRALLDNIILKVISPFYSIKINSVEVPQLLYYEVGGHYMPHCDSESPFVLPTGEEVWKKCVDRDLSVIIFLNDDFEGGELFFPDIKISIRPEAGMMVCFPSNHHFIHTVEPVTKGKRYSLITWMTIEGSMTKNEQNDYLSKKYNIKVDM